MEDLQRADQGSTDYAGQVGGSRVGRILYECHFEFEPMILIPWVMLIVVLLMPVILKHYSHKRGYSISIRLVKVICWCFALILLLGGIVSTYMLADMYEKTVIAYQNDDYQIVEGYVENFDPMPYGGHKLETFEINGVKFKYSDYRIMIGYHNAKSRGGVIKGDGQYLKIGYVYYGNENIIVYIEEYPKESYFINENGAIES